MDRRQFIRKLGQVGGWAALWGLSPITGLQCAGGRVGMNGMKNKKAKEWAAGSSLRETAARKIHHNPSGGFINPWAEEEQGKFPRVLRWKLFSANHFKQHYKEEPHITVNVDWPAVLEHVDLSVTFIKHAFLVIRDRGCNLIVDPVFGSVSRMIEDFSPLGFHPRQMPPPDEILVTHGHFDHMDVPSLRWFRPETHVISPLGYDYVFGGLGMKNRTQLDWFEFYERDGLKITLVPCNHWTIRNPLMGPNRSLWGSFVIETRSGPTLFVSGDAAWFDGYKEIGEMFDIDLAIVNLGAYEPRWFMKSSHMNPAEVARATADLRAKRLVIVHWGTFRLGNEPVHFPPRDIIPAMETAGIPDRLIHIDHGRTLFYQNGGIERMC